MRSILTVIEAATARRLTTVERVKLELGVQSNENDALLQAKIDEASSDIEEHVGRVLSQEQVSERFFERARYPYRQSSEHWYNNGLVLDRWPVFDVVSVNDSNNEIVDYTIDSAAGILFSTDTSGAIQPWAWSSEIVVEYVAGWIMPGEANRNLPAVLEAACIELVQSYWFTRGRDPTVRAEDVPGLGSVTYWVGAIGRAGELPPSVISKIDPFKRRVFA